MKELIRFFGYTVAAVIMTFVVIGIAKSDVSDATLAYSAIFVVVVLPVIISIWLAGKEKKSATS